MKYISNLNLKVYEKTEEGKSNLKKKPRWRKVYKIYVKHSSFNPHFIVDFRIKIDL